MKKVLGLDLGTASIGWALVNQAENEAEDSSIIKLGVREVPLAAGEKKSFKMGDSITTNADRTKARSARRNLQRFKLRRENLLDCLKNNHFITDEALLCENTPKSTFETYRLRAKSATEEITLEQLARVFLMINKKRGYKSSRKAKSEDDGAIIDGMAVAKEMYDRNLTPGQYTLERLESGKKKIPDFYRSDLRDEFKKIYETQQEFYPEILTDELYEEISSKGKKEISAIFYNRFDISAPKYSAKDRVLSNYKNRVACLEEIQPIDIVVGALLEVVGAMNSLGTTLSSIGDRSKEIFVNHITVGQYLMRELDANPNFPIKKRPFYRKDYLDEFEQIWETQAKYHSELTPELKSEIRDIIIFYQRPLKSKKNEISICEYEQRTIYIKKNGQVIKKIVGNRVAPRSSPLFQEFKIWQILNNVIISKKNSHSKKDELPLTSTEKELLFKELSVADKLTANEVLSLLGKNKEDWTLYGKDLNDISVTYKDLDGNKTMSALFGAFFEIAQFSSKDHKDSDDPKDNKIKDADYKLNFINGVFSGLGFNTDYIYFDSSNCEACKPGATWNLYKLWHLLYSYEGDKSATGDESLINKICEITNLPPEYARIIANISLKDDYASASSKAISKILPKLKEGKMLSEAVVEAGYIHSRDSLTKEQKEAKKLESHIDILPKNSLRNPVVEKILNQMINVVNQLREKYGTIDEIHIELARDLKSNAKKRAEISKMVELNTKELEKYREKIIKNNNIIYPSRKDLIRYKLYNELAPNGYKTLYSNKYIPKEILFTDDIEVEHIIPQSKLFDDSYSNKTLEYHEVNQKKGDMTAIDYIAQNYGPVGVEEYKNRIKYLDKKGSQKKYKNLITTFKDIPEGFLNRDLADTRYISRKAKQILSVMAKDVICTTGAITSLLREHWQLVDVMKELNWDKYERVGLAKKVKNRHGKEVRKIDDWSKRNDHRHHAMDALTIAFTTRSHIQHINNMESKGILSTKYEIEKAIPYRYKKNRLRFSPPIDMDNFRKEAENHLKDILVSTKAKNKVVTPNVNKIKTKNGIKEVTQLTPRVQLTNSTFYGKIKRYVPKEENVGSAFTAEKIATVAKKVYREALLQRLAQYGNDPMKAFTGSNSLDKNPLYINELAGLKVPSQVKTVTLEEQLTTRKPISSDLNIENVIDEGIKKILRERLKECGNNAKIAFSNLDTNPIWLDRAKTIALKYVTLKYSKPSINLHVKHDNKGNVIIKDNGLPVPCDYVIIGNNHHVAIYQDEEGKYQERVVSFFEAVAFVNAGLPVIDKRYKSDEGWKFLFTLKKNEYFVFPRYEDKVDNDGNEFKVMTFNPLDIDLKDPANFAMISKNLFRVNSISAKDYRFLHHLETKEAYKKELKDITWKRMRSLSFDNIVKVRVNHIGEIVDVGEY